MNFARKLRLSCLSVVLLAVAGLAVAEAGSPSFVNDKSGQINHRFHWNEGVAKSVVYSAVEADGKLLRGKIPPGLPAHGGVLANPGAIPCLRCGKRGAQSEGYLHRGWRDNEELGENLDCRQKRQAHLGGGRDLLQALSLLAHMHRVAAMVLKLRHL